MIERQPRYSKEEHARRGAALYDERVRPQVEAGNRGKIVAVDVDTGTLAGFAPGRPNLVRPYRLRGRASFRPARAGGATMMTGLVSSDLEPRLRDERKSGTLIGTAIASRPISDD